VPAAVSARRQSRQQANSLDLRGLWWAGPLAVVSSIAAVLVVRVVGVAVIEVAPEFQPLSWGAPIVFTAILVTAAVFVFAAVARAAANPIRLFRRIALVALAVSMIPDLLLPGSGPGATWPAVIILMVMHVVAWFVTVEVLTRWGAKPKTSQPY
jgi:hypothetical protein